jgi:hypothetical protein
MENRSQTYMYNCPNDLRFYVALLAIASHRLSYKLCVPSNRSFSLVTRVGEIVSRLFAFIEGRHVSSIMLLGVIVCFFANNHDCFAQAYSPEGVKRKVLNLHHPTHIEVKDICHYERSESQTRIASKENLKLVVSEGTDENGKYKADAYVRSKDYAFTASRTAADKGWLLTDFAPTDDLKLAKLIEEEFLYARSLLNLRTAADAQDVRALLNRPDIVETSVDTTDEGLVRLNLKVNKVDEVLEDSSGAIRFQSGKVLLDPNQQFCRTVTELFYPNKDSIYTSRVMKWGEVNDQKYPQQWLWTSDKFGDISTTEVLSIRFDEVPESEFTLEAFGIPNPYDSASSDTLWSPTLIMAIAGVVFLAVGFAFRFAQKRRVA